MLKRPVVVHSTEEIDFQVAPVGDGTNIRLTAIRGKDKWVVLELSCVKAQIQLIPCGPLPKELFKVDKDGYFQVTRRRNKTMMMAIKPPKRLTK